MPEEPQRPRPIEPTTSAGPGADEPEEDGHAPEGVEVPPASPRDAASRPNTSDDPLQREGADAPDAADIEDPEHQL
jgi:hypothetical protein